MIPDLENILALDDNEFDDVKAYKIVRKYYDNSKSELEILNKKFDKYKNQISEKELEYNKIKEYIDNNDDVFIPSALKNNSDDELELLNHQIFSLRESCKSISESIFDCTEKIAEFSFILSVLEKNNNDISMVNIEKISNIIDFCIKIIDVDRERVKEELFHVKHLLK